MSAAETMNIQTINTVGVARLLLHNRLEADGDKQMLVHSFYIYFIYYCIVDL